MKTKKKTNKKNVDARSLIIGGTTLIGLGVGFILLKTSALWFVAAPMIGIATGLLITPFIPSKTDQS